MLRRATGSVEPRALRFDGIEIDGRGGDARDELAGAERLRQVVVGALVETEQLVGLLAARGGHDDRRLRAGVDAAADLDAVEAGQHQVEHDQVRGALGEGVERGEAVPDDAHVVALAQQVALDDLGDDGFVLDDEDAVALAGHAHPSLGPRWCEADALAGC